MSTFGGALWGSGIGGNGSGTVGVPLSSLIMPAYRIAGITQRAMITPSNDMYAEAIPELNRLLGSWNCDGHKIFTTSIDVYPLNNGQKIYTIGPGGDFDADRPNYIRGANVLFPTSPVVRRPLQILDDDEWRRISVQDIAGAPPYQLYYDGSVDENGLGNIFIRFQPPDGYQLELYTWQRLSTAFTSRDSAAILPDGYEHALVYNLAKGLAALNPKMAAMSPAAYQEADRSAAVLISLHARSPQISCEAGLDQDSGPGYGWLSGDLE